MTEALYGCIEAGGTKFIVGIAASPGDIRDTVRFDTVSPAETIGNAIAWLRAAGLKHGGLRSVGIASFGPLELDRRAANWGHITATTKPGWSNCSFGARVAAELDLPVGFDTDVNGAALAETRWGEGQDQPISIYLTVGTGIGGGAIVDGKPLQGLSHPEMGHIRPQRHPDDLDFGGVCPFHGDCLEGLASGPAIKARWGVSLSELPADHSGHDIIAWYLGQLVTTLQSVMEPGRIIMGGGVMATPGLLDRVRVQAETLGGGYFRGKAGDIIVAPGLADNAGLLGGLALAQDIAT
ncbi:MAG TPA: ROK family protein [Sphingorhabdus sp.]|jgi:fructokinase|nr:ROK family protein [Sphingorhabdus sp.]